MMDIHPTYLVMVTSNNNNKFYRMIPNGNNFIVEFGRVGSSKQTSSYPLSLWDTKYREKIAKGYVDQSDLHKDLFVKKAKPQGFREIENKNIASLVARLQQMANQSIKDNYTISSAKVTNAMVDEAQTMISLLTGSLKVEKFNELLLRLYTIIPRKMDNVLNYLAKSPADYALIINREQDLLDVMRGQVVQRATTETEDENLVNSQPNTILEAMGLEFSECTNEEVSLIKELLGSCSNKYAQAWRVRNCKTQNRFDNFVRENNIQEKLLLWHGSRNENWWSIINSGLVLRPTNAIITGKMFGMGCYFAPKAQKSLGYTSLNGSYWVRGSSHTAFMALMSVAYGKPYDVYNFSSKFYDLNYEKLQRECQGANSLHAHAGSMLKNDEIVVYREEQVTISYLVELHQ